MNVHARVRHTPLDYGPHARDVRHIVVVSEHEGPRPDALCGLKPKGGWVLRPVWTVSDCQRCFAQND